MYHDKLIYKLHYQNIGKLFPVVMSFVDSIDSNSSVITKIWSAANVVLPSNANEKIRNESTRIYILKSGLYQ